MSRSIHDTWALIEEAESETDPAAAKQLRSEGTQNLQKQRAFRQGRIEERRREKHDVLHSPAFTFEVFDASPFTIHPANEEDLRRLVPAGIGDGLRSVELRLQRDAKPSGVVDPFLGILPDEILPHVYTGNVLGTYHPEDQKIVLYGYVAEPSTLGCLVLLLRLRTLETFAHELGHHFDHHFRRTESKWKWSTEAQEEQYAYAHQALHSETFVLPFLEEHYGEECEAFRHWCLTKVGIELPLVLFLELDPRESPGILQPFQSFCNALSFRSPLLEARLRFAEMLSRFRYHALAEDVLASCSALDPYNEALQELLTYKKREND